MSVNIGVDRMHARTDAIRSVGGAKKGVACVRSADPAFLAFSARQFEAIEVLPLVAPRRVASVDALRGFTMFWIIGADGAARALAKMLSGGGMIRSTAADFIAGQFEHVEWEGLSFYDLILPLFIFVTGVAIVFSLTRLVEQESMCTAHWRVLRRSVFMFALGAPLLRGE